MFITIQYVASRLADAFASTKPPFADTSVVCARALLIVALIVSSTQLPPTPA